MIDKREAIMVQLATLLAQVQGIRGVFRNRGELPPHEKTPGIVLLDGREKIKTKLEGRNFIQMPAAVFTIYPQIFLALTPRDDITNTTLDGDNAPVGEELSMYRMRILNAIMNDETLVAMMGANGSIVYNGFDSDMMSGSTIGSLGATMQFHFEFSYMLNPDNLI